MVKNLGKMHIAIVYRKKKKEDLQVPRLLEPMC